MHILVVNDDGPPNDTCSPYVLPFVRSLRQSQHTVTVVIPSVAQSWISKAHLVGKSLKSSRLYPNPSPEDDGIDWNVVDGTPASCTQLGLYYLTSRPVDMVVSGPNWGRNVTTLYNLASGTVGGALEGAQCGKKALAISFASKDKEPTEVIEAACRVATRLVSHFSKSWAPGVELYAINVPMIPEIDSHRAIYTTSLPCHWTRSSLFQEVDEKGPQQIEIAKGVREFKWRPHLKDVEHGIANAPPGTDGSAMVDENVSVTPMIATFKSPDLILGDVFERA